MNALRTHLSPTLARISRKPGFAAAPVRFSSNTAAPAEGKGVFIKRWLSDPATYPIIGIITFACSFCLFCSLRCLFCNPDVTIGKKARMQVLRTHDGTFGYDKPEGKE
mmetsp:Transcript_46394/g.90638  ORF Transcript_46394/g.90638 Transcript_46394/m.90638 type:complete len:108 (-) Transcript_46394:352-675(-)